MTEPEEVVAAGPNGLFYFRRLQDHAAKPWTQSRPLPCVRATLDEFTVSGLALYLRQNSEKQWSSEERSRLYLYCVSGGVLYNFYLSDKKNSSFLLDTSLPLAGCKVTGKPTVVRSNTSSDRWSLVVPCQFGGLFHTSAVDSRYGGSISTKWEAVDRLATDLGIISAVSVTAVENAIDREIELVAVCISSGQLNVVQGSFDYSDGKYDNDSRWKWEGKTSTRILHPGEVTGNPELITDRNNGKIQLDLLVSSTEGGIFHFVRTKSAPNDWHMIGRVAFPQNIPPASCLSFHSRHENSYGTRKLYALVQIRGRLYHVRTTDDKLPWYDARLNPIVRPGPFLE